MSITVDWLDGDPTILHVVYAGKWTWADFDVARQQSFALRGDRTGRMYIIHHLNAGIPLPDSVLLKLRSEMMIVPDDVGFIVIVGASFLVHNYFRIFGQLFGELAKRLRFTGTLEEARALIAEDKAAQLMLKDNDGT